jgi:hypothetical protein
MNSHTLPDGRKVDAMPIHLREIVDTEFERMGTFFILAEVNAREGPYENHADVAELGESIMENAWGKIKDAPRVTEQRLGQILLYQATHGQDVVNPGTIVDAQLFPPKAEKPVEAEKDAGATEIDG